MQSAARVALPEGRVKICLRYHLPERGEVDVYRAPVTGSAHYGGLMVCGSIWVCACCAAKVSERRRDELSRAIGRWRELGGVVLLVSSTFSHGPTDELARSLGAYLDAYRWMTGGRLYRGTTDQFGIAHTVRALEVTWGPVNGWHPHGHTLAFCLRPVDVGELQRALSASWSPALARFGLRCSDERGIVVQVADDAVDEYVAKWGREPEGSGWTAAHELVKANSKRVHGDGASGPRFSPFDLLRSFLETGETVYRDRFREFAGVFKGKKQLSWSKGARAALGLGDEQSDEELATELDASAALLGSLDLSQWAAVREAERRGELLEVARSGDWSRVVEFVRGVVARVGVSYGLSA